MSIYENLYQAKFNQQKQAIELISKWRERMDFIKTRKENPLSEITFCKIYDIHLSRFNQIKNGKCTSPPSPKLIKKVEAAFKSEGA